MSIRKKNNIKSDYPTLNDFTSNSGSGNTNNAFTNATLDGTTIKLTRGDDSEVDIDLSSIVNNSNSNQITNIELDGTTLTITKNDGTTSTIDLSVIDNKDAQTINGKQIDELPSTSKVLIYNYTSDKFEFTDTPNCDNGNIIMPTTIVEKTGIDFDTIDQLIADRIGLLTNKTNLEPAKYVVINVDDVVPINRGLIKKVEENDGDGQIQLFSCSHNVDDLGNIYFETANNSSKLSVYNVNDKTYKKLDLGHGGPAQTQNGKRIFTQYGKDCKVIDIQDDGSYAEVLTFTANNTNMALGCSLCGDTLTSASTRDNGNIEVMKFDGNSTFDIVFSGNANIKIRGRACIPVGNVRTIYAQADDRTMYRFQIKDDYSDFVTLDTIKTKLFKSDYDFGKISISDDERILACTENTGKNVYFYVKQNNEEWKYYGKASKDDCKGIAIDTKNNLFHAIDYSQKDTILEVASTLSGLCNQQKDMIKTSSVDVNTDNIAITDTTIFNKDKRGSSASDANESTFFIAEGKILYLVDSSNNTKKNIYEHDTKNIIAVSQENYKIAIALTNDNNEAELNVLDLTDINNVSITQVFNSTTVINIDSVKIREDESILLLSKDNDNIRTIYATKKDDGTYDWSETTTTDDYNSVIRYDNFNYWVKITDDKISMKKQDIDNDTIIFDVITLPTNINTIKQIIDNVIIANDTTNKKYYFVCIEDINNANLVGKYAYTDDNATTSIPFDSLYTSAFRQIYRGIGSNIEYISVSSIIS